MAKPQTNIKKYVIAFCLIFFCVIFFAFFMMKMRENPDKNADIKALKNDEYTKIHISMYDLSSLNSDWYEVYFGTPIEYTKYQIKNVKEAGEYLKACFLSKNIIETVYLSLDCYDKDIVKDLSKLTKYVEKNPDTEFYIFAPFSKIDSLENDFESKVANLREAVSWSSQFENCSVRYIGDAEWLSFNELNYSSDEELIEDVDKLAHIYLYGFDAYNLTEENIESRLNVLTANVGKYRSGFYDRSQFQGYKLVFFGDSVFARPEQQSLSIAGVMSSLTGANYYNIAVSGSTAAQIQSDSFVDMVDSIEKKLDLNSDESVAFFINYGFNDYFSGVKVDNADENPDVSTYEGALIYGIEKLKDIYPNSKILLVTPYVLGLADGGNEAYSEGGYKLTDYVNKEIEIAASEDIFLINMYENSGITLENSSYYLTDCVHPTLQTNFDFAELIVDGLGNILEGE